MQQLRALLAERVAEAHRGEYAQGSISEIAGKTLRTDVMTPRTDDVISAARLSIETKLSFWDAMIVQMAIQADCAVLFSEDMQAGRRFAGVEIVNPFMAGPGKH